MTMSSVHNRFGPQKDKRREKIIFLTLVAASLGNLERKAVLIKSPILIELF